MTWHLLILSINGSCKFLWELYLFIQLCRLGAFLGKNVFNWNCNLITVKSSRNVVDYKLWVLGREIHVALSMDVHKVPGIVLEVDKGSFALCCERGLMTWDGSILTD